MATDTPWTWLAAHLRVDGASSDPGGARRRPRARAVSILAVEHFGYAADRQMPRAAASRPAPAR